MEPRIESSDAGPETSAGHQKTNLWFSPTNTVEEDCPIYREWFALLLSTPGKIDSWEDYDRHQGDSAQTAAAQVTVAAEIPRADVSSSGDGHPYAEAEGEQATFLDNNAKTSERTKNKGAGAHCVDVPPRDQAAVASREGRANEEKDALCVEAREALHCKKPDSSSGVLNSTGRLRGCVGESEVGGVLREKNLQHRARVVDRGEKSQPVKPKSSSSYRKVSKGSSSASEGARRRTETDVKVETSAREGQGRVVFEDAKGCKGGSVLDAEFPSSRSEASSKGVDSKVARRRTDGTSVGKKHRCGKGSVEGAPVSGRQRKRKRVRSIGGSSDEGCAEGVPGKTKAGVDPHTSPRDSSSAGRADCAIPSRTGIISLIEEKDDDRDTCVSNEDQERRAEEAVEEPLLRQVPDGCDAPTVEIVTGSPDRGGAQVAPPEDDDEVLFVSRESVSSPRCVGQRRSLSELDEAGKKKRERLIFRARRSARKGKLAKSLRLYCRVLQLSDGHETMEGEVRAVASIVLGATVVEKEWGAFRSAVISWALDRSAPKTKSRPPPSSSEVILLD